MARRGQGEGSIYQDDDGRWRAAITLGWRINSQGKPVLHRKFLRGATRTEVQQKLTKKLRERDLGLPIPPERQTVEQFLRHWLKEIAKTKVRDSTFASYEWIIQKHIVPGLGRIPLAKLSPQQIQTFLNDRLKTGRQPRHRRPRKPEEKQAAPPKPIDPGLTPRTVQHIHAILRTALEQALRWNLVSRNVATLVSPPRVRRNEFEPYTPEQAQQLLEALKTDRLAALYSAAMAVGLRQGEALGLRWSDIDFETSTVAVRNSLQRVHVTDENTGIRRSALTLVEVKADRSRRTIVLPQVAIRALLKHRAQQETERQAAGDRWKETGFVFTTTVGTPLDGSTVTHRFQAALEAAGLRRIRFHDLRHTCATLLLAQGVHPRVVMDILGHSQIGITMNLYAHVLPSMRKNVASRMDKILAPVATKGRVAATIAATLQPATIN